MQLPQQLSISTITCRKPKSGAPLDDYNRFIIEKYIKKRYVSDKSAAHPLQQYKNGTYEKPNQIQNPKSILTEKPSITPTLEVPKPNPQVSRPRSDNFSLLDDD